MRHIAQSTRLFIGFVALACAWSAHAQLGTIAPDALVLDESFATRIGNFHEGFAVVERTDAKAIMDAKGNLLVPYLKYVSVGDFFNGYALVHRLEGSAYKAGFIDTTGKEVVATTLYNTRYRPNLLGYVPANIDVNTEVIFDLRTGKPVHELKKTSTEQVVIDNGQRAAIAEIPIGPRPFLSKENTILVKGSERALWGFEDRTGKIIIPARYTAVHQFNEGLAAVQLTNEFGESKWGFIDENGKVVIEPMFTNEPGDFHSGRAYVRPMEFTEFSFGYINRNGDVVVKLRSVHHLEGWRDYRDGYILVHDGSKRSLTRVDTTGNQLLLPTVGNFQNVTYKFKHLGDGGPKEFLIMSLDQQKKGLCDINGIIVLPPVFDGVGYFDPRSGLARAFYKTGDGKVVSGFVDRTGSFKIVQVTTSKW